MIRKQMAKFIGYPLQDIIKHTKIIDTLKVLRKSQYWDDERIKEHQSSKLRALVSYAYNNVPYYKEVFDKVRLKPSDIKSVDDIVKIPILTKEIARRENDRLIARNYDMRYVRKGKTGGTTGPPMIVYKDVHNRSLSLASYYRWFEWMGINYYESTFSLWGASSVLSHSYKNQVLSNTANYLQNKTMFNSFEISKDNMEILCNKIIKAKPVLLNGYLSSLLVLASYLKNNNIYDVCPKALSSTTETLLPHHRVFLEEVFNSPIFDQYGCGELSAISYECKAHKGLHINQEHILCEILDDNDAPIVGTSGRVVGTDLDNSVMPFIRYENGDKATMISEKCTCGVNQPLMSSIDGRVSDYISLKSGGKVHGVFFTDILYELGIFDDSIQRFQVYQEKPGFIDFKIEGHKSLDYELRVKLLNALKKYFHEVNFSEHKYLESDENGKFRYIINNSK